MKKLYKGKDKALFGVCSGFAKYWNFDVTVLRILWALSVVVGGFGLFAYIVCAIVMPEEPNQSGGGSNSNAEFTGKSSEVNDK